jgi:ATP-dependent Clp protease ATP-binding subunit ClpX
VAVDTSNILFILSGAFVGIDRIIQDRKKGDHSMGFGAKVVKEEKMDPYAALDQVTELDLIRYGLIPEFIGRIPLVVAVNRLSENELVRILREPKNSLVEQYTRLFGTWAVNLEFTDDALHAIAKRVMDRQTGARGLKFAMVCLIKPHLKSRRNC